jgi:hypothetical protein
MASEESESKKDSSDGRQRILQSGIIKTKVVFNIVNNPPPSRIGAQPFSLGAYPKFPVNASPFGPENISCLASNPN